MLGLPTYLYRLLPANPILLRVVENGGKKKRDLFIRCGYLGLLVVFVCFSLFTASEGAVSLSGLANASREIFHSMSYLQLGLVALLAPIFTAGAITQEKDSQTYDILLATPLTNGQIVLGSLMSRLFFVLALLISGFPIFSVCQIFGGVANQSIAISFGIAGSTACVTGALAMAIATFKVGTRRTIFSFYLFIVIYLVGGALLDQVPSFHPALFDSITQQPSGARAPTSWLTGINPFLALRTVDSLVYQPPDVAVLPPELRTWPLSWYLTDPSTFYIAFMFSLSVLLVLPSILLLRRMAQSTLSFKGWLLQKVHLSTGDKNRKPRYVWANPIAWREAKTKASAARASFLRYSFMTIGVAGASVLVVMYATPASAPAKSIGPGSYNAAAQTLFIQGDTTYGIAPDAKIILNGNDSTNDILYGHYAVDSVASTITNHTKSIAQLNLLTIPRRVDATQTRQFLLGAVILEFAVILLIVTNAAASTVTREKEDGSLDLLLTTPITSRYYIWGKLRGLVSFVLPLVAVPVVSSLLFIVYDVARLIGGAGAAGEDFKWIVFPEALLLMPATLVIVVAFAAILGMQMSLRCRTTVRAVMSSVGIVIGLCAVLVGCGNGILDTRGANDTPINLAIASFSPFTVMSLLIDPYQYDHTNFVTSNSDDIFWARFAVFACGLVATAAYAAVVWAMYKSMVKNFDMTIRRQQR
jgi:ABC-type transport system involved in multi-copper enzyme maturation permease subunit